MLPYNKFSYCVVFYHTLEIISILKYLLQKKTVVELVDIFMTQRLYAQLIIIIINSPVLNGVMIIVAGGRR